MPSLGDVAQAIAACVLVFNAWQSWRNGRAMKRAEQKIEASEERLKVVQEQTNGLNAKLVEVTGAARYAEGVQHGKRTSDKKPESQDDGF